MKYRNVALVFTTLFLVQMVVLAGCATNPVTGKKELSLVSSQQELQIGRDGYQAILQEYGGYDHAKLAAYVDTVGKRLAAVSHTPNIDWHFTLLDDPIINAFAMPGGYVYITRGILAHLNSEAQLAGVLGHEIGHITARHTAQRLTQQQLAGLGLGLASMFSEGFQRYSGAAQQALGLLFLKYGRDDENQADQLGVEYVAKAGYDPREIPPTYAMLRRTGEKSGQSLPTFLSTHPDPGDREVRTSELARAAAAGKTGLIVKNRDYVRKLDGVVFGSDPRQGYFDGARFVHPELGFEITFPAGWKTQNTRAAVLAAAPDETGGMQLTLADAQGQTPEGFVAELQRAGKIAGATGARENIGGFAAWVGELAVPQSDGTQAALFATFIRRSSDQFFQILGRSTGGVGPLAAAARSFRAVNPNQVAVTPAHVKVVTVATSGPFETVVASLGPQAIGVEETSILNNLQPQDPAAKGTLLKIVEKGSR